MGVKAWNGAELPNPAQKLAQPINLAPGITQARRTIPFAVKTDPPSAVPLLMETRSRAWVRNKSKAAPLEPFEHPYLAKRANDGPFEHPGGATTE